MTTNESASDDDIGPSESSAAVFRGTFATFLLPGPVNPEGIHGVTKWRRRESNHQLRFV